MLRLGQASEWRVSFDWEEKKGVDNTGYFLE